MKRGIKSRRAKILIVFGLILVISGAVILAWRFGQQTSPSSDINANQTAADNSPDEPKTSLRLILSGDVIAHDSVNQNAQAGNSYNYLSLMANMKPYFDKADVRFCNQATPAGGRQFGVSGYPVFNAPLELTRDMVRLGCNVINTGTNHTYDKGQSLIDAMVAEWERQDVLAHAGANRSAAERDSVKYFENNGLKFAFLSYSTYSNSPVANGYGVTMYNQQLAERQLKTARDEADIILVSMRWGTEYSPEINTRQTQISQFLADNGADIIVGHGPHVLQPVKRLKAASGGETIVWYSIGNFLNTQLEIEALTGVIGVMDIDIKTKKITELSALPIYNHYDWSPDDKRAERLLARQNVKMYALDQASEQLASSLHETSASAQVEQINNVLNKFTTVKIIESPEY